mmetsp:Transcript_74252/g.221565  ORF Transcript_74252/g.221565 Transcript_74252/m.221565 type:complete len:222 (+) Transcript_74252:32-697(+)
MRSPMQANPLEPRRSAWIIPRGRRTPTSGLAAWRRLRPRGSWSPAQTAGAAHAVRCRPERILRAARGNEAVCQQAAPPRAPACAGQPRATSRRAAAPCSQARAPRAPSTSETFCSGPSYTPLVTWTGGRPCRAARSRRALEVSPFQRGSRRPAKLRGGGGKTWTRAPSRPCGPLRRRAPSWTARPPAGPRPAPTPAWRPGPRRSGARSVCCSTRSLRTTRS